MSCKLASDAVNVGIYDVQMAPVAAAEMMSMIYAAQTDETPSCLMCVWAGNMPVRTHAYRALYKLRIIIIITHIHTHAHA